MAEEGGINLYAFVENDPINYFDALGLRPEEKSTFGYFKCFAKELKTNDVGKEQRKIILSNICDNFTDYSKVKISRLERERSFWRRWGGKADELGRYGASGPRSAKYTRNKLAVKKDWNTLKFESRFKIKKGGLLIEGLTAPQVDIDGILPGKGQQLFVPNLDDLYIAPLK